MIYLIKTKIGKKEHIERIYNKGTAAQYYLLKVREMCFPDEISVEILNDGES